MRSRLTQARYAALAARAHRAARYRLQRWAPAGAAVAAALALLVVFVPHGTARSDQPGLQRARSRISIC